MILGPSRLFCLSFCLGAGLLQLASFSFFNFSKRHLHLAATSSELWRLAWRSLICPRSWVFELSSSFTSAIATCSSSTGVDSAGLANASNHDLVSLSTKARLAEASTARKSEAGAWVCTEGSPAAGGEEPSSPQDPPAGPSSPLPLDDRGPALRGMGANAAATSYPSAATCEKLSGEGSRTLQSTSCCEELGAEVVEQEKSKKAYAREMFSTLRKIFKVKQAGCSQEKVVGKVVQLGKPIWRLPLTRSTSLSLRPLLGVHDLGHEFRIGLGWSSSRM
ncbi:hypothetical protein Cgig2_021762 [Carnegiea gigantea]|uniref:Uncharacterized protein n=1 Tax=Carnegiea gigantea TaxID=171969 RepID=A0A9Q1GJ68_9CARY|nr:hypothetical protein Cgig2_021762 [Carnegiea gigantea]